MRGDFSWFDYRPLDNFTGVLEQQGRVRLDRDGLHAEEIARHLRTLMGRDAFGPGRVAVPSEASGSFRITAAETDGSTVNVTYQGGRAWIDGIPLLSGSETTAEATYLDPPLQPAVGPDTIAADIRDAVVLEVWEEAVSAFQDQSLLEPALGGVDTTERVKVCHRLRLRRLADDEDCRTIDLTDDISALGRLTVTPEPAIAIAGDCPVEAGGGYTGDGHRLFCIEVAAPDGGGPRFLWSRHGGGLVGRGRFDPVAETIAITHNRPMIDAAMVTGMRLQALAPVGATGCWEVVFEADVSMPDDVLAVTGQTGTWPVAPGETAFFRLWDGAGEIADFAGGAALADGIRLDFDAPNGENYRPGDRWMFQARAAGVDFDPSVWPDDAPPLAVRYHRAPLGILTWSGTPPVTLGPADIADCRDSFPPLTDPCPCCTITVGDGRSSHGDEDSIEAAIDRLPSSGGRICLLPGLHEANAVIQERADIRIVGCGKDTQVVPRPGQRDAPIFHVIDSECVELLEMEMVSLGGVAILAEETAGDALRQLTVARNRIVACVRAVQVEGGSEIVLRENRIRMLDKQGAGVAIYILAEDSRIEDNDIGVVPADVTPRPPDDPDDDGTTPDDPNDPCADDDTIYADIGFFVLFVQFVLGFTIAAILPQTFRALGGVQIGSGAARLAVIDNVIRGGAGNGITLGGHHLPGDDGGQDGPLVQTLPLGQVVLAVQGVVEAPDGTPAPAVTLRLVAPDGSTRSFTTSADGAFQVQTPRQGGTYRIEPVSPGIGVDEVEVTGTLTFGAGSLVLVRIRLNTQRDTADPRLGFLYDIRIDDNDIREMGLNGIGIPPALDVIAPPDDDDDPATPPSGPDDLTTARLASARQPRFAVARAAAVNPLLALLGHPTFDLSIRGNRLERNVGTPFTAAMRDAARTLGFGGISLGLCETVTIAGNRIEANGRRHIDPICGIFVLYGEQVEITDNLIRDNGPFVQSEADLVPGLRSGIAGIFLSIGPDEFDPDVTPSTTKPALRVHDNVVEQPMGRAMTILAAGPVSVVANHLGAARTGTETLDMMAGALLLVSFSGAGGLPSGGCLVNSNQIALGPDSGAMIAVAIAAGEDLGLDANQIDARHAGVPAGNLRAMLNTLIFAGTVRTTGNRFQEPLRPVQQNYQVSLISLSTRMNVATSNQGDHCIYAFDQGTPQRLVAAGNIVFETTNCLDIGSAAAGAALNPIQGTHGLQSLAFVNQLDPPTGAGRDYAGPLNASLVSLNGYHRAELSRAAEYKSATAALLGNEVARLRAQPNVRDDLVEANRRRFDLVSRDITRLRAAEEVAASRPEPGSDDNTDVVLQGRVMSARGAGLPFVEVRLADARGTVIDAFDAGETDAKGRYVLRLSGDALRDVANRLGRGATVVATLRGDDTPSVTSAIFQLDERSVIAPDIRITVPGDTRPPRLDLPIRDDVRPVPRRPVLRRGVRRGETRGRISPLLRNVRGETRE